MFKILKIILLLSFIVLTTNTTVSQIKFAVIGDYGSGTQDEGNVANLINTWNVDFIITVGDNNYPDGAASTIDDRVGQFYSDWIGDYQGNYGSGSSSNKFFPSLGNHDWHTIVNGLPEPYLNYFNLPGTGFISSSGNELYYDFEWSNIHFFVIDSDPEEPDGVDENSIQGQWFSTAITNCVNNHNHWRIVYFHYPPYCTEYAIGGHGSNEYMQWDFVGLGADAVLSGHAHKYERLIIDGLVYFVNGLGGMNYYASGTPIPGSQITYGENFGAMLVIINDAQLTFRFINVDNELIDFHEIIHLTPIAPNAPSDLITTAVSQTQVGLTWQDNSSIESGFSIERKLPPSTDWTEIAIVSANITSYIDTGLVENTDYCYRLRSYNTGGSSLYSNEACLNTNPALPAPPSNLTADATGVNEVTLNWTDNSGNETAFIIEREYANLPNFNIIDSVNANVTSYIDSTVLQGVSYNYRVSAYNLSGQSGYSNVSYVTSILPSPNNLVGQLFIGPPYSVLLNWQDVSDDELGFVIERDTIGLGNFEILDSVVTNVTSYADTNFISSFETLHYRLYAFTQDTVSDYSNIAEIIIPVELISFSASVIKNAVKLNWITATETNNRGFELERKLNSTWETIVFINGNGSTTEQSNYDYIDDFKYSVFKGVIFYRLKQIDFSGVYDFSYIIEINVDFTPTEYVLYQNYPNPFNPITRIDFALAEKQPVSLRIYNTIGELVKELVNEEREAGSYSLTFDASNLPSGVYIYRLQTSSFTANKKMTLLK